jgi:L-cysteine:1D-myo-inositol 2-amino-2-deoxy-alpha-D-glucopyranoside ligase
VRSWSKPDIPELPGRAPVPRVFDDSTGALVSAKGVDGRVGIYVCGITPYDATHLGHAATYLAFDTLQRAWRDAGLAVHYTQNVTDIDDPLLERATLIGVDWFELAQQQTDLFREDMTALGVIPPDDYVAVTDVIDDIAAAVEKLQQLGFAYPVPTPDALVPGGADLYFDLEQAGRRTEWHLGVESRLDATSMADFFAERGGDPGREGKRNPLDPLLWRAARAGEPHWPSVVGEGRPGWHIECSVIALQNLGEHFCVQGGGSDLVFPHHEFSAGHATALTGRRFADVHAHSGMVAYEGEKMSKSLGNLVLVSRLRESGADPRAIRLAVLAHHYREDWEWRDSDLTDGQERLARWQAALSATDSSLPEPTTDGTPSSAELALLGRMRAHLADDLDTPAVLTELDRWAVNGGGSQSGLITQAIDALLGVRLYAAEPRESENDGDSLRHADAARENAACR